MPSSSTCSSEDPSTVSNLVIEDASDVSDVLASVGRTCDHLSALAVDKRSSENSEQEDAGNLLETLPVSVFDT